MENTILYGLFSDGGNCYSSRDDANWFWSTTDYQTRTEFRKNLKRAGELRASRNYGEYDPSSIKVRVFTSKEAFLKAAKKVGLNPAMGD